MGIITNMLEKRSFDNQQWIKDWLRGKDPGVATNSGVEVSPESAVRSSTVLACGRLLSETIAALPLFLYRRLADNAKERATDHPLYEVLHIQPNKEMSSFIFREMMMWHLLFWGNSFSWIDWSNGGDVLGLWPLLPWKMEVKRTDEILVYKYQLPDNTFRTFPREQILHIPGMSFDGLVGRSLLSLAREPIGLSIALEQFGAEFFGRGINFGGFLETDSKALSQKAHENLRSSLKEKYQGISNTHKLFILEEGMKYKQNVIPLNSAQFLESRKFQAIEVARMFNVPLHLIQELDRATFNNIEQLDIGFSKYTITPWVTRIEQTETVTLLGVEERKRLFIKHLLEGLLRGDIETRYEAYNKARMGGWMSADEIRALEDMNPIPDGKGQGYWRPLNMVDTSEELPPVPDQFSRKAIEGKTEHRTATHKTRIANSHRKQFRDMTDRLIKVEKDPVIKAAKRIFGKRTIETDKFNVFLREFYDKKYGEINKRTKAIITNYGNVIFVAASDEVGVDLPSDELDEFMAGYTETFNARYIATSENRLSEAAEQAALNGTDSVVAVEGQFDYWEENRPGTVSLKETIQIAGAVSVLAYGMAGIGKTVWVAAGASPCPFCLAMSGKVVSTGTPFKLKSDIMTVEEREPLSFSSNISHAPLHGGCECQVVPG